MSYAADTKVSTEASRNEIERTLTRYGADQFMYGWDQDRAIIGFRFHGRQVRFTLQLPNRSERRFTHTPKTKELRSSDAIERAWEQACRQKWRALALIVKAKLEAVESGVVTFESEFLAHILLPNGQTTGEWVSPQIELAYSTGSMPSDLPALGTGNAP